MPNIRALRRSPRIFEVLKRVGTHNHCRVSHDGSDARLRFFCRLKSHSTTSSMTWPLAAAFAVSNVQISSYFATPTAMGKGRGLHVTLSRSYLPMAQRGTPVARRQRLDKRCLVTHPADYTLAHASKSLLALQHAGHPSA